MKNNKKIKNTMPVIETKKTPTPGTVGEFIEFLSTFPPDGKFDLNGSAHINMCNSDEVTEVIIHPRDPVCNDCSSESPCGGNCNHNCDNCNCDDKPSYVNDLITNHLGGLSYNNPGLLNEFREMATEKLIYVPVMAPNQSELLYENIHLDNNQSSAIDEIRAHNNYVAECLGELHRREVAALLEYNTQCLAHFGVETNKTMCRIVQKDSLIGNSAEYFDEDEV